MYIIEDNKIVYKDGYYSFSRRRMERCHKHDSLDLRRIPRQWIGVLEQLVENGMKR